MRGELPISGGKQAAVWPLAKDGNIICDPGRGGLKADDTEQASCPEILCWSHQFNSFLVGTEHSLQQGFEHQGPSVGHLLQPRSYHAHRHSWGHNHSAGGYCWPPFYRCGVEAPCRCAAGPGLSTERSRACSPNTHGTTLPWGYGGKGRSGREHVGQWVPQRAE